MTDEILSQGGTPAPDANAAPVEETKGSAPDPSPGADAGESKEKPDGFTKRIDELTRDFRTAQRERDAERFEREKLNRELEQLRNAQRQPANDAAGKTLADFGHDEEAFAEYVTKQAEQRAAKVAQESAEKERASRNWAQFQERAAAYAKDNPGYTEAFQRLQGFFPDHVANGLVAVEEGPALVEFLGSNLTEAISLRSADPFTAGMLIGQLQSRIKGEREKAAAAAKKDPPPAPAPKLEGAAKSGDRDWNDPELSYEKFVKHRKAVIAQRK